MVCSRQFLAETHPSAEPAFIFLCYFFAHVVMYHCFVKYKPLLRPNVESSLECPRGLSVTLPIDVCIGVLRSRHWIAYIDLIRGRRGQVIMVVLIELDWKVEAGWIVFGLRNHCILCVCVGGVHDVVRITVPTNPKYRFTSMQCLFQSSKQFVQSFNSHSVVYREPDA